MRPQPAWLLSAILLLGGCGTEPSPDIVGTWTLTSSHSGGGFACSIDASLVIDAAAASVTGSLIENQVSCTEAGQPIPVVTQTHAIVGKLDGRKINFATQIPEGSGACAFTVFDGRVTETSMTGVLETQAVFCQGTFVQMHGTWEAQRQ